MEYRTLKIQPQYRQNKTCKKLLKVPRIILEGNWLHNAGFSPNETVLLTVEEGSITIKALPPAEVNYIEAKQTFNRKYQKFLRSPHHGSGH